CIYHVQIVLRITNNQCSAVWPEGCARAFGKLNPHAFQHRYRVRSADKLTVVQQSLTCSGSPLHGICLTCSSGTATNSSGGLKTYCLLLNNFLSNRWHLSDVGGGILLTSKPPTAHITSDVVPDIERAAEEFRRHVISLGD